MKILALILAVNLHLAIGQTAFDWKKESHFDSINIPGQKSLFRPPFETGSGNTLTTGSFTFRKAQIKDLGEASYTRHFKDTVIIKVELSTTGKKSRDAFLNYYKKLVNDDYNLFEDQKNIRYIGFFTKEGLKVKAEFSGSKNGKISQIMLTSP
ncbi:hypothetical protein D3C87_408980 [compost metagenome]